MRSCWRTTCTPEHDDEHDGRRGEQRDDTARGRDALAVRAVGASAATSRSGGAEHLR